MQKISILGSTGSVGTQALSAAALYPDQFEIIALTANRNETLLFEQVRKFRPKMAGIIQEPKHIPDDLRFCEWVFGEGCLQAAATQAEADACLVAVVGIAGLPSVLHALSAGKRVLLANKEALVAGGELVMQNVADPSCLLPVDSEHSAIFQCLQGAFGNKPKRIILTASGGPFRDASPERIAKATVQEALSHPNWKMGKKISIDSASMMNKALEIIEAYYLFGVPYDAIDVRIHRESIVHSMVEFADGAVLAQLGIPDMRIPILYAMHYPARLPTPYPSLDFTKPLSFEKVDAKKFPSMFLAYEALRAGGVSCAVLNAANECAVEAFLAEKIPFSRIYEINAEVLAAVPQQSVKMLADVLEADTKARLITNAMFS